MTDPICLHTTQLGTDIKAAGRYQSAVLITRVITSIYKPQADKIIHILYFL